MPNSTLLPAILFAFESIVIDPVFTICVPSVQFDHLTELAAPSAPTLFASALELVPSIKRSCQEDEGLAAPPAEVEYPITPGL